MISVSEDVIFAVLGILFTVGGGIMVLINLIVMIVLNWRDCWGVFLHFVVSVLICLIGLQFLGVLNFVSVT